MTPSDHYDDDQARQATISGLRELADFLQAHPDLPVSRVGEVFCVIARGGCDACQRADIDRIAALLASQARSDGPDGHYCASPMFGLIEYKAVHVPARPVCTCPGPDGQAGPGASPAGAEDRR